MRAKKGQLPALPAKYRQRSPASKVEDYGFRWGAFLASLACMAVGLGMSFGAQARDPLWYGVAAFLIAASRLECIGEADSGQTSQSWALGAWLPTLSSHCLRRFL